MVVTGKYPILISLQTTRLLKNLLDFYMTKCLTFGSSLTRLLAVVTDSSKAEPSARTLSQESHSPAPSDDQSDSRWRDIFGSLSG